MESEQGLSAEVLEESLLAVKSEFMLIQRVVKRLNDEKRQAELETGRLQRQRDLLIIEKNAIIQENVGFKGTYKILEKELRKAVRELDDLREKAKDLDLLEQKNRELEEAKSAM